jgi:hypothetical protein
MRVSIFEIFLFQIIFYSAIWLWDDYVATFMCIAIPVIVAVLLGVSLLAELFEPSRISRKYFWIMGISIVAPMVVGIGFYWVFGGELDWMEL